MVTHPRVRSVVCFLCVFALVSCGSDDEASGGAKDGGASPPPPGCSSQHGPEMARVALEVETFCIDRTEVTRAQYGEFVAAGALLPAGASAPSVCAAGTTHVPEKECSEASYLCKGDACGQHPQTCVSYCDAVAYCAWAGKELCGEIGGGYAVRGAEDGELGGRWVAACGDGLLQDRRPRLKYSYGSTYNPALCNAESGQVAPVGTSPQCTIASDATVLDMIGNVAEWNGVLRESNPATKVIEPYAQGGASFDLFSGAAGTCGAVYARGDVNKADPTVGFRCCKSVD